MSPQRLRNACLERLIEPCPRCGYIGRENWKGHSYFKCVKCGYEADRDRTASRDIALRATKVANLIRVRFLRGTLPSTRAFGKMKGVDGIETPRVSSPCPSDVGS